MSKLEIELQKLLKIQQELGKLILIVESKVIPFQSLTKECLQYILQYSKKYCHRYLKIWFRSFLAMKDECMILVNGEIIRSYHISIHEKYVQTRDQEKRYYNTKCTLSRCSIDGLDYEYRQLQDRYGQKSSLDKIADKNDEFNRRIDMIVKSLEDTAVMMKDTMTKISGKMKYEIRRHCSEYIEVSFENSAKTNNDNSRFLPVTNNNPVLSFILQSEPLRKISQAVAFSTIVEPPPSSVEQNQVIENQPNQIKNPNHEEVTSKVKRKRKLLQLSDSDEEESSVIKKSETPNPGKRELDLNFGIEVSIDEIKKAYGVTVELAVIEIGHSKGSSTQTEIVSSNSTDADDRSWIDRFKKQYLLFITADNVLRSSPFFTTQSLKIKIINPYYKSNLNLFQSSTSTNGLKDLQSITFSLELFYSYDLLEPMAMNSLYPLNIHPERKEYYLLVEELFHLIRKYLWYHYYDGVYHYLPSTSNGQSSSNNLGVTVQIHQDKSTLLQSMNLNQLWVPKVIQIENVKYSKEDHVFFPLHSITSGNTSTNNQGLVAKKYPALCEGHELILHFMNNLHNWVVASAENEGKFQKLDLLWKMLPFLDSLMNRLKILPLPLTETRESTEFIFTTGEGYHSLFTDLSLSVDERLSFIHKLFSCLFAAVPADCLWIRSIECRTAVMNGLDLWVLSQHFVSINCLDHCYDLSEALSPWRDSRGSVRLVSQVFQKNCILQELYLNFCHTFYQQQLLSKEAISSIFQTIEDKFLQEILINSAFEGVGDNPSSSFFQERLLAAPLRGPPRSILLRRMQEIITTSLQNTKQETSVSSDDLSWFQFCHSLFLHCTKIKILYFDNCFQLESISPVPADATAVSYSLRTYFQIMIFMEGIVSAVQLCKGMMTMGSTNSLIRIIVPELDYFPKITQFYQSLFDEKQLPIELSTRLTSKSQSSSSSSHPADKANNSSSGALRILAVPNEIIQKESQSYRLSFQSIWNWL